MGRRLYVGNLNYNTDEQTLRAAFGEYGDLKDVKVITDRETGRSKGFGFVEFVNEADAANALTQMNGQDLDGRGLRVNEAEDRRGGSGGGGGGGGFRPSPNGGGFRSGPPSNGGGGSPPPDFGGGGGKGRGKKGGSRRRGRDDYDDRW